MVGKKSRKSSGDGRIEFRTRGGGRIGSSGQDGVRETVSAKRGGPRKKARKSGRR